jgi:DNA-directed RNA polymerase specialized sigma24 family protein
LTKDGDDANDLVQDTLVKAFTNRDKYQDGTNLKAWLFTIMKNTFITQYQRMVRRNTFIDTTENLHNNANYVCIHNFGTPDTNYYNLPVVNSTDSTPFGANYIYMSWNKDSQNCYQAINISNT